MAASDGRVITFARELLLAQMAKASKRIWLGSPFLSAPVANAIREAVADATAGDRRLLTDLDQRAVECGVLSPEALSVLGECGFTIASVGNLHAKVSLVDAGWGLIGSGNLTGAGLGGEGGGNYEMGVLLDAKQRRTARETFGDWWSQAKPVGSKEIAWALKLPRSASKRVKRVGPDLTLPSNSSLAEILAEDRATAASRRYWVNANYHDPDNEMWWRRNWVSDGGPKSYARGDLLVIYLGKKNDGPQRCPAVVRVVKTPRCMPDFVREHRDPEAAERWPWVTMTSLLSELPPFEGARLEAAGRTPLSVENGCELSRDEFVSLARGFPR